MEYIQGDITLETSGLIIHGVNCQKAMGSGVALAIKTRWPIIYEEYMKHPQGKKALGTVQYIRIDSDLVIANCWTQEYFGNDGKVYADPDAVLKCIMDAIGYCEQFNLELKSPKIAAGLAGLDWDSQVVPLFEIAEIYYPTVKVKIFVI